MGQRIQRQERRMRVAVALPGIDAEELSDCAADRLLESPAAVGVLREDDSFDPAAVDRRPVTGIEQKSHAFIEYITGTRIPGLRPVYPGGDLGNKPFDIALRSDGRMPGTAGSFGWKRRHGGGS